MQALSLPPFDPARYQIVRQLGAGGTGTVYLALDRETGEQLALKRLERLDQKSVLRFKREFRSLAELHHPNLIRLYDLWRAPDAWYLTMEAVDGRTLIDALRGSEQETLVTRELRRSAANGQSVDARFVERIVASFQQLAAGVRAVHRAGMLHRDLKPSNVMVAKNGRVVVLDFGLVRDLDLESGRARLTLEDTIAGTPAYMSPEQAAGQPLSEASDWYSFGVMLYECLCGRLPVDGGSVRELIARKSDGPPMPLPDEVAVPPALRELCMALLERDPAGRPSGEQVSLVLSKLVPERAVRATRSDALLPVTDVSVLHSAQLFGRDHQLAQLSAAFERTRDIGSVVAHVRGLSGAGKSALVERFLDEPQLAGRDVLVLRSRCYEREAMPFKALDGVVDALVTDLLKLDDIAVAHVLPRAIVELTQLFPVLERLPAVARLIAGKRVSDEAAELRRRAENALNELITRLAEQRTLVVWIDDLQWGDLDSASVIRNWLDQRAALPILLIFSYRSDEVETSVCLKQLLDPALLGTTSENQVFVDVTPLKDGEVRALCRERLSPYPAAPSRLVDRIVEEARGSPFLAQQLVALALAKLTRGDTNLDDLSMEELVLRTGALLQPEARELLNVLAVAGRPLARHLALTAAGVRHDARRHIHALQTLRLVRTRAVGGQRWLEVYHDRVREGVQSSLDAKEREQLHARLLSALEAVEHPDPDWLHELALGAGLSAAAFRYGLLAADRASAGLAFERAAELYARCLKLNQGSEQECADIWLRLAATLARCRRGAQAAEAYLRAAELVALEAQPPLLRLAASHLVRSGRFEEGEALVLRVLDLLGLDVPKSELGLMAAIGWERVRIAVLGYEPKKRHPPEASARLRRAAELYGTLAVDTQLYAPLRAALFQTRSFRLALESGDPVPIARAMGLSAALACITGTARAARYAAELHARNERLTKLIDSEDDLVVENPSGRALCAMFLGRPLEVLEHSAAADRAYAIKNFADGHGDYFYMFAVHAARLGALSALGRHSAAREELATYLARAEATDNRVAILQATLTRTICERTADNCAGSRARLDAERAQLPKTGFGVLHVVHLISIMQAACATGDYDWAIERLAGDWPAYLSSAMHRTAYIASVAHASHARLVLNHRVAEGGQFDALRVVRPDLRALARLPSSPMRESTVLRLRARCAWLDGDADSAIALFRSSAKAWEAACCLDEPERDRFALGCILGGEEGAQLRAAADAALRAVGVRTPVEELRGYYPELFAAGLV